MALSKRIGLGNGVAVNYHRVVSVNCITNVQNVVEVASYTSRAKREEERAAIAAGEEMNVYVDTRFLATPYDQGMTVDSAYEWIKANRSEFDGAGDVLEDGQMEGGDADAV